MAVTLRLARRGTRHRPYYHIVAADSRCARDGRYIEQVGRYDPLGKSEVQVDAELAKKWLAVGALPSAAVAKLLQRAGVA